MKLKSILLLSAIALIGFSAPVASARTHWSIGIGIGFPGYGYGYPYYGYPSYGYYPYGYGYGYSPYGYSSYPYGYRSGYSYSPYSYGYSSYRPTYRGQTAYRGGSVVVQVQERLARAGYYHGRVDGVMGSQTRSAIRAYQRSHNMRADGMINDHLLGTMSLRR
ncbi:MAG: peptidoglycan-binding protein [Chthoniobacterales bacterium]